MCASSEFEHQSGGAQFPHTRHSAIVALRSEDSAIRQRALSTIARVYWNPVYHYVTLKWHRNHDDARDLTQEFFLQVLEKDFLSAFDPVRAKFRTFLRLCIDRFVQKHDASAARQKRGGDTVFVALDNETTDGHATPTQIGSPEDAFEREWMRSLMSVAVEALRVHCLEHGRDTALSAFERYDLDPTETHQTVSYQSLAMELTTSVTDITNQLAYARREFRRIVLETLRDMTSSEEEFRDEARTVLGITPP